MTPIYEHATKQSIISLRIGLKPSTIEVLQLTIPYLMIDSQDVMTSVINVGIIFTFCQSYINPYCSYY